MKVKGFLGGILLTAMLGGAVLPVGALTGTSAWATEAVEAMACGLEPASLVDAVATEPITRAEFCAVALLAFERLTGDTVERTTNIWFTDCADPVVNTAHEKGLIAGKGDGTFAPEQTISRQDLCVMLQNVLFAAGQGEAAEADLSHYADSANISPYARKAVGSMLERGILYGVNGALDPMGTASREQALILAYRLAQEKTVMQGVLPVPELVVPLPGEKIVVLPPVIEQDPEELHREEERADDPEEYYIEQAQEEEIFDQTEDSEEERFWESFLEFWWGITDGWESEPPEEAAAEAKELLAQADTQAEWDELAEKLSGMSQTAKEIFVYGTGEAFTEEAQARAQQAQVKVPVWRLSSKGQKTAGEATLTVHTVLAPIVKQIFTEIFAGAERFPIADVGGFAWRSSTKSEHRQGSAIDLNWNSNMEATVQEDGTLKITTGDHWTPGEDPFSIPMDGDVVRAFEKYGFAWGGTAWSGKVDYMHFSFFGR